MTLVESLRSKDKKGLFLTNDIFANYSTGFPTLDYINGFYISWFDENMVPHRSIVKGVIGGRFITIFGSPGTGKTTLGDEIGWNIVGDTVFNPLTKSFDKKYESGIFMHIDIEQTAILQRLLDVTGATRDDARFIMNTTHTNIEDVMDMVSQICEDKEKLGDDAMYTIDGRWFGKKTVKVYQPTVLMLDSLPSFVSRDMKVKEIEGQMSTNRDVAMISQFYIKMLSRMTQYNITIIAINQLKPKPNVSIYDRPLPQLLMLKDSETLPRGQAPVFYASACIRINQCAKGSMYTYEEDGFDGFKAVLQLAKTKTAFVGGSIPMVFNSNIGYDPIYSLLVFAEECKLVQGRNPHLYITGAEAFKFSRKTFREKFINDTMFNAAIMGALTPTLEALVGAKDNIDGEDKITQISMSKLFIEDADGNLTPHGIVESDNGITLTA